MAQFQSDRISTTACSTALQEAFPHSPRKRISKAKHMYVIGIELSVQQESRDPVQILRTENEQLSIKANQLGARTRELEARIQELEAKKCTLQLQPSTCSSNGLFATVRSSHHLRPQHTRSFPRVLYGDCH